MTSAIDDFKAFLEKRQLQYGEMPGMAKIAADDILYEYREKYVKRLEAEQKEAYEKGRQDAFNSIPTVLTGDAAKAFEKYQNTPATQEAIEYMKQADEVYKKHNPEEKAQKGALKAFAQRVKEKTKWYILTDGTLSGFGNDLLGDIDNLLSESSTSTEGAQQK